MANYTQYASPDAEWVEYAAARPEREMPPELTHDQRKDFFNASRAKAFADFFGPIEGVDATDVVIPTSDGSSISAKLYRPEGAQETLPLYIHLHAGGFYFGNIETEDVGCRLLCLATRSVVMNVNYRHTPEWSFPTPMQDTFDALDWILENHKTYHIDSNSVIVGGISAGAGLACAAALRELDNGKNRISGLILTSPPTVHQSDYPRHLLKDGYSSLEENAEAPILPRDRLNFFQLLYNADRKHSYTSPLIFPDEKLKGFPPTCFHIAGLDPFRDEGLLFAEKLAKAEVKTQVEVYPGLPHAFMGLPQLKASEKWREDLGKGVAWLRELRESN